MSEFSITVKKGIISDLKILDNKSESEVFDLIRKQIKGSLHEESSIRDCLLLINDELKKFDFTPDQIVRVLF